MTSEEDLANLKELLKLHKYQHILDESGVSRHNSLIEWATYTYWKIGPMKISNKTNTSIDNYYSKVKTKPFELEAGDYTFLRVHLGNVFVYAKGSAIEVGTGISSRIDKNVLKICDQILSSDSGIEFIRLISFKNKWIIDDVISKYQSPHELLEIGTSYGVSTSPYLRIRVNENSIFDQEDFDSVMYVLESKSKSRLSDFISTSVCYVKDGCLTRSLVDLSRVSYVCVKSIDLEKIDDNLYVPSLITKSNETVSVVDVEHLINSKIKLGSFIKIKRVGSRLILQESGNKKTEDRGDVIRGLLKELGNDFFVNGKYLSNVKNMDVSKLVDKLGIDVECERFSDLSTYAMNSSKLKDMFKTKSPFEIARECFNYPESEFIILVNNMHFQIEHSKVLSFDLEKTICLDNPTIEIIYGNFGQFVALFNILVDVKKALLQGSD